MVFRKTKKILIVLALVMSLALISSLLISCKGNKEKVIVASTTIVADAINNVAGDYLRKNSYKVVTLIGASEEAHDFSLDKSENKTEKLNAIKNASLFVGSGFELESSIEKYLVEKNVYFLSSAFDGDNHKLVIHNHEHEHEHEEEHGHEHGHEDEEHHEHEGHHHHHHGAHDPHFWFDLNMYKIAINALADKLGTIFTDAKDQFKANAEKYSKEIDKTHLEIAKLFNDTANKLGEGKDMYLVTGHDAFHYFARAYNFKVTAPRGTNNEADITIKDMEMVAKTIVNNNIKAVFVEETSSAGDFEKLNEKIKEIKKDYVLKLVGLKNADERLLSDSLGSLESNNTLLKAVKFNAELICKNIV